MSGLRCLSLGARGPLIGCHPCNADLVRGVNQDNFLPVIDLLDKSTKVAASKAVLTAFAS